MGKATLRLYKLFGLLSAMAAVVIVVLGHLSIMDNKLAVPAMLMLLSVAAFCCANTQEETGSRFFSKFCVACGIVLVICAVTITVINYFIPASA